MSKINLKKDLKDLYNPSSGEISVVDVPSMNFIMIDGSGDPNKSQEYREAIETLYSISYTLKFMVKKEKSVDYGVMPLEGLWWADDITQFSPGNKDIWKWTAMIMQPEYISEGMYQLALKQVGKKKPSPALSMARLQSFCEGLSAQIMYTGPYSDEGPAIEKLHRFIKENGYFAESITQKHHEIYLGNPGRTAPEKLKTIIRQPVTKI